MPEPNPLTSGASRRTCQFLGLGASVLAGTLVLLTLGRPGITIDEPIDVKVGRNYMRMLGGYLDRIQTRGLSSIGRAEIDAIFEDNRQHPPMGRVLLGLASVLAEPAENWLGGADPMSVHAGRVAPMLAFSALVGLIAATAARQFGIAAGVSSSTAMVMMPRVFAHAHFATLDTFLALFWTLALLKGDRALGSSRPGRAMGIAGLVWGLALLTKIHAFLLPPLVLLDGLLRFPRQPARLLRLMLIWGLVGALVFLVGWPWLWSDTWTRLTAFLSTSVERVPLRVLYFGKVYLDRDAPWHYPWVYFAVTVPIGLHALGLVGAREAFRLRRLNPLPLVLLASILQFLILFSTKAPVYDGERLFLHVFPAWALLVGVGFQSLWSRFSHKAARIALGILLASQAYGLVTTFPYGLSYYNQLVGGLAGAEREGLELTYWGDCLDRPLLNALAEAAEPGDVVAVVPSLHHLHPTSLLTPELFEKGVQIAPAEALPEAQWLLVFRRTAYIPPEATPLLDQPAISESSRSGVWLARLIRIPARSDKP